MIIIEISKFINMLGASVGMCLMGYALFDNPNEIKMEKFLIISMISLFLISVLFFSIAINNNKFIKVDEIEVIKKQNDIMKMKIEQKNLSKQLDA